jgi:hypothetical protein
MKRTWRFTLPRRASMRKAQKVHQYLVRLGEKARARGMRL